MRSRNYGSFEIPRRARAARLPINPYLTACVIGTALGVAVMAAITLICP